MSELHIDFVQDIDIERLCEIDVEARRDNPITQARFPLLAGHPKMQLEHSIALKRLQFKNTSNTWLKAVSGGKILGFAIWTDPAAAPPRTTSPEEEALDRAEHAKLYEDADRTLLRSMAQQHDEAESKVLDKHWYLDNIVTAKEAQGKGVGSALLDWGLKRADAAGLPIFCLSSSEGYLLYSRRGFETIQWCHFATEQGEILQERALLRAVPAIKK